MNVSFCADQEQNEQLTITWLACSNLKMTGQSRFWWLFLRYLDWIKIIRLTSIDSRVGRRCWGIELFKCDCLIKVLTVDASLRKSQFCFSTNNKHQKKNPDRIFVYSTRHRFAWLFRTWQFIDVTIFHPWPFRPLSLKPKLTSEEVNSNHWP
jgi:hypothetical protein